MENRLRQFLQTVDKAQAAVIESQGNGDLERFQLAQNLVLQAKEQLREVDNLGVTEEKKFHRAKEQLRKLEETQRAIEGTIKF